MGKMGQVKKFGSIFLVRPKLFGMVYSSLHHVAVPGESKRENISEFMNFEEYLKSRLATDPEAERQPGKGKGIKTELLRISGKSKYFDRVIQKSELEGHRNQYMLSLARHETNDFIKAIILNVYELEKITEAFNKILKAEKEGSRKE